MRAKRGATLSEVVATLDKSQQKFVKNLASIKESKAKAERSLYELNTLMYSEVKEGLNQKIPVRVIADTLGVTTARIYQIRDNS